jgi:hypothetical protein
MESSSISSFFPVRAHVVKSKKFLQEKAVEATKQEKERKEEKT